MNKKINTIASTLSLLAAMALPISTTTSVTSSTVTSTATPTVTTSAATDVAAAAAPTTADGQITSAAVSTTADLNAYTAAALSSDTTANAGVSATDDAKLVDVSYQDNAVTADFTQPAKFLGLFPMSIDAQATVRADGTTTVAYPWYSFLVRKHAAAINDIFQTQVTEATGGKNELSTSASATMSVQAKATALDAIRQAIHGLRSKAAVSATASVTAQ